MSGKLAIWAFLVALAALGVALFRPVAGGADTAARQPAAYERILSTRTLRCAYAIYPPTMMRDPNTGKLSGIFHDLAEEIARLNGLRLDWVEEVPYGNIIAGFDANRYDAFCAALWPSSDRAQKALFSVPAYFSAVGLYVKPSDRRFDGNLAKLNDPAYKFSVQDGDVNDSIAKEDYPLAKRVSIPQMAESSLQFLEVASGKADALFAEVSFANAWLKSKPGTLRNIAPTPIRFFPNVFMLPTTLPQLKVVFDTGLQQLIMTGFVRRTIEKYGGRENGFLDVAAPYR